MKNARVAELKFWAVEVHYKRLAPLGDAWSLCFDPGFTNFTTNCDTYDSEVEYDILPRAARKAGMDKKRVDAVQRAKQLRANGQKCRVVRVTMKIVVEE